MEWIDQKTERKERLTRQLDETHDVALLRRMPHLLAEEVAQSEPKAHQLPPRVRQSLEIALQQVKDGETIPGETVFREIDEWLGSD